MNTQTRKELLTLFRGWEILFYMIGWFIVNYLFFYVASKNPLVSVCVGIVGALFFFFVFSYKNLRLKTYQFQLNELLKYVTNMSFYLKTGENVLHALENVKETLHTSIQKDVEKSIQGMRNDAVLQTGHFGKYDFPTLNQFHQNLVIKYEHGGDPGELFSRIQKNMITELKKRDELYRKRKAFAFSVYMLLGMVMSIELMLRFVVPELWDMFLSFEFASMAVLLMAHLFAFLNLFFLQKKTVDISVRY
ncbi:hypothetical protein H7992_05045 [Sporosarcina sp. resist]|uniref:hypothetical protein n=1 Tax=Sporosarcina sp. resist TaxID=2762563 RepID=UPI00164E848B|nr:hypothetical protein [Sporosarcina sp. resist]QNK89095.1 hypothetical protein H7992_05045 [Sporosarcina sp. resist]